MSLIPLHAEVISHNRLFRGTLTGHYYNRYREWTGLYWVRWDGRSSDSLFSPPAFSPVVTQRYEIHDLTDHDA